MLKLIASNEFVAWLEGLRGSRARKRIANRLDRLRGALFGDAKSVGGGVSELRIDHGPGYRVYFARRGDVVVVLLCGGDKSSQQRDIRKAKALLADWEWSDGAKNHDF